MHPFFQGSLRDRLQAGCQSNQLDHWSHRRELVLSHPSSLAAPYRTLAIFPHPKWSGATHPFLFTSASRSRITDVNLCDCSKCSSNSASSLGYLSVKDSPSCSTSSAPT